MSVTIRKARGAAGASGKRWEYDIRFWWPDGTAFRERANAPVAAKSAATRWAEAREAALLVAGKDAATAKATLTPAAPVVTFGDFWPKVVRDHYRANRKKPSTIDAAEGAYRTHLSSLAALPLAAIRGAEIAALKGRMADHKPKTVNNILSVLSRALRCAVEWGDLLAMPKIGLLPVQEPVVAWYERHDYRRLVDAAAKLGTEHLVLVLLGGSAGLRRGEIRALKWSDIDFARKLIRVQRAIWRQSEGAPKGGRGRDIPMTDELAAALKAHRHMRGPRVLYSATSIDTVSNQTIRNWMGAAIRRAGLPVETKERARPKDAFDGKPCRTCGGILRRPVLRLGRATSLCLACEHRRADESDGPVHKLRHTFCSHLAVAGVPAKAIQELAGHTDLKTTQRYMHLSPSNRSTAIETLGAYHATTDEDANEKGKRAG